MMCSVIECQSRVQGGFAGHSGSAVRTGVEWVVATGQQLGRLVLWGLRGFRMSLETE